MKKDLPSGGPFCVILALADGDDPALFVGQLAPLDAGHGVVQLLGDGADLAFGDEDLVALPVQLLDGRDHSGGAGAEDFLQGALVAGLHDVLDGLKPCRLWLRRCTLTVSIVLLTVRGKRLRKGNIFRPQKVMSHCAVISIC